MNFKRTFKMLLVIGLGIATLLIFNISCQTPAPAPPTPSPGLPPAPTPGPPGSQPVTEVVIEGFTFAPETITVPVGTTVTWYNEDSVTHTVSSREDVFDSGNVPGGATFTTIFEQNGSFDYYCKIHPYMNGKIIVE